MGSRIVEALIQAKFGFEDTEIRFLVMGKGGFSLFVGGRQRHSGLQPGQS